MAKGIILATLILLLWAVAQPMISHVSRSQRALSAMGKSFVLAIAIYFVAYLSTPASLGFLPNGLAEHLAPLGIFDGFLILGLLFLMFVLFYYSINRAITLVLITTLALNRGRSMTVGEIEESCGVRSSSVLDMRLEALLAHRFVSRCGDRYVLARLGRLAAKVSQYARIALKLR